MGVIFAQNVIIENAEFYRDYLSREDIHTLKDTIFDELHLLRNDAVALTYTLQFTDKILGPLASADLDGYSRFIKRVESAEDCFTLPKEWEYLYAKQ